MWHFRQPGSGVAWFILSIRPTSWNRPEISPTLPQVLADEDRLIQILINLIGNGLQYTPSGGQVEISAIAQADQLEIRIKDSGIGIASDHLPLLFTRFYRVDKSRSRMSGGSGIGLTIVKHLVEKHGGQVRSESAGEGHGSTFTFTLPLTAQAETDLFNQHPR
jgi:histidine kinase